MSCAPFRIIFAVFLFIFLDFFIFWRTKIWTRRPAIELDKICLRFAPNSVCGDTRLFWNWNDDRDRDTKANIERPSPVRPTHKCHAYSMEKNIRAISSHIEAAKINENKWQKRQLKKVEQSRKFRCFTYRQKKNVATLTHITLKYIIDFVCIFVRIEVNK